MKKIFFKLFYLFVLFCLGTNNVLPKRESFYLSPQSHLKENQATEMRPGFELSASKRTLKKILRKNPNNSHALIKLGMLTADSLDLFIKAYQASTKKNEALIFLTLYSFLNKKENPNWLPYGLDLKKILVYCELTQLDYSLKKIMIKNTFFSNTRLTGHLISEALPFFGPEEVFKEIKNKIKEGKPILSFAEILSYYHTRPTLDILLNKAKKGLQAKSYEAKGEGSLLMTYLGHEGNDFIVEDLIQIIETETPFSRLWNAAALALGKIKNPKAIEPIYKEVHEVEETEMWPFAKKGAIALGYLGDERGLPLLEKIILFKKEYRTREELKKLFFDFYLKSSALAQHFNENFLSFLDQIPLEIMESFTEEMESLFYDVALDKEDAIKAIAQIPKEKAEKLLHKFAHNREIETVVQELALKTLNERQPLLLKEKLYSTVLFKQTKKSFEQSNGFAAKLATLDQLNSSVYDVISNELLPPSVIKQIAIDAPHDEIEKIIEYLNKRESSFSDELPRLSKAFLFLGEVKSPKAVQFLTAYANNLFNHERLRDMAVDVLAEIGAFESEEFLNEILFSKESFSLIAKVAAARGILKIRWLKSNATQPSSNNIPLVRSIETSL